MRMKEAEGVFKYVSRVETVVNQLGRNVKTMPTCRVVEKILRSLTDDFDNIVCIIEESKELTALSVEELVGSLEVHEQRRRKSPLIKHSKQRQPLGRRRFLILRTVEAEVVEVEEDMKEVKNRSTNKTGMAEDCNILRKIILNKRIKYERKKRKHIYNFSNRIYNSTFPKCGKLKPYNRTHCKYS